MKSIKPKDIERTWQLIDAKNKILGRLSSQIATYLAGKNKVYYVPYLDTGNFVVVINAEKIRLSGKKETQKKYWRHSGYPGGLYAKTASQIRKQKPELLIRNAVYGMLPKTTLGRQMLKKLHVFAGGKHPFSNKFKPQQGNMES
ncbi:50S ribosomal protein L13 [Candidatus Curtissbacteria bacterium RIFCSPLOWO2_01_FULL_42_26]|uniref:Large ribosomal subunit protein uL13 n=1 Tax=Candidatus Curtissbacteria bacterium RIFCSPLOWO2_01_FULL_42_26 TaxID=1797729 RepID=A0A1F5I2T9_9BACT|nr:MAG: 50S ribosomal protein L13 [Candidatus Curtissbacteria bacterium RIFCSPLOWO2_01_FULL_42_26]